MSRRATSLVLVAAFLVSSAACGTMYRPEYTIVLERVEVMPPDGEVLLAGQPAGAEPPASSETSFQDDWLRTDWALDSRKLDADVKDLGRTPLLVRCDEAAYVAVDGSTHRVLRRDVRRADAVVLPAGKAQKLALYPSDFLVWEKGKEVEWKSKPLIPHMPGIASSDRERAEAFGRGQVGASFELDLPVELDGRSRVYRYVFTVKAVKVHRFMGT